MTTAYSSLLGLALPVQGELSGTWGDMVDNGITQYVDVAVAGTQSITGDSNVTLSLTNGTSSATNLAQVGAGTTGSAQYAILNCTGARTADRTITVPASSRVYNVINATTGGFAINIVGVGPTTGISVADGEKCVIAWNGSDFVKIASTAASNVTGVLGVPNGGTGVATVTLNYIPYGNGVSPLSTSANLQFDGTVMRVGSNALLGGTTNPVAGFTGGTNNYIQSYIYNATNGASSSADFVAYASNSTDAHGWADMGFTSPTYADATYTVTGPNEAYLFGSALNSSYTGNLVYATDSTGSANAHQWYVGGFTQAKGAWKMQLTSTGLATAGTVSPGGGIISRVVAVADATSVTMNADTTDMATQTNSQATGTLTMNAPTGTPVSGQKLMFRLASTNVQTFAWNAVFAGSTDVALPTTSTGSGKYDYVGFIYNSTAVKWQLIAKNFGF